MSCACGWCADAREDQSAWYNVAYHRVWREHRASEDEVCELVEAMNRVDSNRYHITPSLRVAEIDFEAVSVDAEDGRVEMDEMASVVEPHPPVWLY